MRKSRIITILICICILVNGCSAVSGVGTDYVEKAAEYTFEFPSEEVVISYEVPTVMPNVLVDRFGYEPEGEKIVVFRGEALPATFTIRERESDRIVYTGNIKTKNDGGASREYNGYGEFTEFKTEGDYYIQVDTYGESYPFLIHGNLYYSLFKNACSRLHSMRGGAFDSEEGGWQIAEVGENKEIAACLCLYQLLLAYEIFPEVYTDDTGIEESGNGTPDILDECRYEIQWLIHQAQISPDGSSTACGYRAAVLAKYAYLTKNIDNVFAGECLRAAESAWKSAGKDANVSAELLALAASELYRMTGSGQYRWTAEEYLRIRAAKSGKLSDLEFFSSVTYMKTKSNVDVTLCDALIGKLMDEAETISRQSKQNEFLVCSEKGVVDRKKLLREMLRISVVNHVITNHEYNTVIENHFHYLMGRNPEAVVHVSYWEGQELQTQDILQDTVQNAALIFMLSGLVSNQINRG